MTSWIQEFTIFEGLFVSSKIFDHAGKNTTYLDARHQPVQSRAWGSIVDIFIGLPRKLRPTFSILNVIYQPLELKIKPKVGNLSPKTQNNI